MQRNQFSPIILICLLGLLLSNCKNQADYPKKMPDVSSYVYAYTSGTVSKTSPFRIRFTKSVVPSEEIGQPVDNAIFQIKPQVNGLAIWEDDRTILFEPETHLTSGTSYTATVSLNQLFENVPPTASSFLIDFRTKSLRYDVSIEGLRASNTNNIKNQTLLGFVQTLDLATEDLVEKGLQVLQNGKNLAIKWQHLEGNTRHQFIVEGVNRGAAPSELEVKWDAAPLGIKASGQQSVEVPSINEFKVVSATVQQDTDPHIILNFTDPLLKNQELNGLITIKNYSNRLRYIVDGNLLKIYPTARITGNQEIVVNPGIKNINGVKMPKISQWNISIADTKPQVRLVGKGAIMPNSNGLIFPFEAISLKAIEVEVVKIYDNNILQFLQTNALNEGYDLERVGNIILQEQVTLSELDPTANPYDWSRYAIDLSKLINDDPYAIYQIRLGFRPSYSLYSCGENENITEEDLTIIPNQLDDSGEFESIWGSYYGIEGLYEGYEWTHRQNPCFPAYYNSDRFVRRNVLASDIGMIAKNGKDGSIMVAVSDIKTTLPLPEVQLDFYDYQQQLIKTMITDGEGMANTALSQKPFAVIASKGNQKGYLRLFDPNALSLSRFDVAGAIAQKGIKGFIYGERGVWRPGDSIYLNFILEDKLGKLPADHPISFKLIDPKGQVQQQWTSSENVRNIYPLSTKTASNAPTGNWLAKVSIGGATFTKRLQIETVKPNRLKINLDFGKDLIVANDQSLNGSLQVNWLHGAPARKVAVKIEQQVRPINTVFKGYQEYEFDDPSRQSNTEPQTIFDKSVDENGQATVNIKQNTNTLFAGMCATSFNIRAFEKGGDFSTSQLTLKNSPYPAYAGIFIKKNKYGEKRLDIGKESPVEFIALDETGKPLANRNLKVGLYRINWRWWWDSGNDNVSQYNSAKHYGSMDSNTLRTNAKGETIWNLNIDNWGRYLVRVCDTQSGHCAGDIFYAGYPWDDGENTQNREAAAMLAFSVDKDQYAVGDKVELSIPSSSGGRALISLENGSKVIESYWADTQEGETKFSFYATAAMTPTIYANVSLIQPHAQVNNDLPIRLYGVIPVNIEDESTKLSPILKMPNVLEPEQTVTVEVSEKNNQAMAYTIAMVDDGLLDLTNFKTPRPWDNFYAREALGVKTWDIYDYVLGAYGGSLERVLAIGGDAALKKSKENSQANRFQPVVKQLGPFYLKKGKTAKHKIKVPNYVGSVRTMVVGAANGAYGSAEATSPVKKSLMVLATLPRVLGPTEELMLPVTVFAMDNKVKNVSIKIEELNGLARLIGTNTQNISFPMPGESLVSFPVKIGENVGIAKFKVTASGAGEQTSQEIEIQIRNPNPYVSNIQEKVVQPGQNWNTSFAAVGMTGTNQGILEISNIPPISLGKRLNYLIRYPHGCIEQTISAGFPQLFVNKLMEVDDTKKQQIQSNITSTIERVRQFQISNGGMGYWPGDNYANTWGTNYAGHFLLEAQQLGYNIPAGLISKWKSYQKRAAQRWNYGENNYDNELTQAYRLYTLALANAAEIGAMNRLRENTKISDQAKWRLAAAYSLIGRKEIAQELIASLNTAVKDYRELSYTYGSGLRDEAMILESLVAINDLDKAASVAKNIANQLSSNRWFGTQTVAYSLLAISKFIGDTEVGNQFSFTYQLGNKSAVNAGSTLPIMNIEVPIDNTNDRTVTVTNTSKGVLYVKLITSGQPLIGDQTNSANNLKLSVKYLDLNGNSIDPARISQGTDFVAQVSINNPGNRGINYEEMALTQIFPSGWEILNTRLTNIQRFSNTSQSDYQDIRDDRVYTYFDVNRKATQTYNVQLNAAYEGRYYLPTVNCEAMYDNTISARTSGQWVEVVEPSTL